MLFLLVTTRADGLSEFMGGLTASGKAELLTARSRAEALDAARSRTPDLVIVDRDLPGESSLALVAELLTVNAMINTAVVSSMTDEEFHEESEGLGVLSRVPPEPGKQDGEELTAKLCGLLGC